MDDFFEIAVPLFAFFAIIGLAAYLLIRQRAHARPEDEPPEKAVIRKASRRQQKILEKLEPIPELPTVMDLMRMEIEETGVEKIPGHEGLPGPVMLKVYRRDKLIRERCTHDAFAFVLQEGVEPPAATEDDVTLFCDQCGVLPTASGTEAEPEAL